MAEDQDQERNEQATPRRKEESRKKGQVARSQEVVSVTVLLGCILFFYFGTGGMVQKLSDMISRSLRESGTTTLTQSTVPTVIANFIYDAFMVLFPFLLTVFIAALNANYIQVGFLFSSESLKPKFSKISPMNGFKRLFGLKSLADLVKNICKLVIVVWVSYWTITSEVENLVPLMDQSIWGIMVYIGDVSFKIIVRTCWVLVVLAVLDYLYQRWEYERGLKMSKQEIKDEYKQTEGDPLLKSRIKRLQREMARKRMMSKVPSADVVITNPDHIAVALKYDQMNMAAPVVVAKGADLMAEKIKELARKSRVPVVENKPLARILFKLVKVDGVIPENLYKAVAEVLAYVYSLKRQRMVG
jgi:flagellar biosynthetic protein FlhB